MIAVYDANVLYPSPLRDFLIRVAIEELVVARWSQRILDEAFRSVARDRPDLDPVRLARTRRRMCDAVLDSVVTGFEELEGALTLPDVDDRHVVAAAIRAGANVIVTFNLRDFPEAELARHGLLPLHRCTPTCSRWSCSPAARRRCSRSSGCRPRISRARRTPRWML